MDAPASIDAYISSARVELRERLQAVRETIQSAAPDATEAISYQIPTFRLNGNLIHFSAAKKHIGVYGQSQTATEALRDKLAPYLGEKGAIRFPHTEPLPLDLLRRVVELSAQERRASRKH